MITIPNAVRNRVYGYRKKDKKRGQQCTITFEWYIEHIHGRACVHCGSTDKIGADRKDNTIGHTPENCQPCCQPCNSKLGSWWRHGFQPDEIAARRGAGGFAIGHAGGFAMRHAQGGAGGFAMRHAAGDAVVARA